MPGWPSRRTAKPGDAGLDLLAAHPLELAAGGGRGVVGTGLAVAIPFGCCGLILPRSGLARNHGVTCPQHAGPDRTPATAASCRCC